MAKTYVSNIGLLKRDMPTAIDQMVEFLLAIVEAVTPKARSFRYNTG